MENVIIYNTCDRQAKVKLYTNNGTIWVTREDMARLLNVKASTINRLIKNIYDENVLNPEATNLKMNVVKIKGARKEKRLVDCYSLDMIYTVGYHVCSPRTARFHHWVNRTLKEFLQKSFVIAPEQTPWNEISRTIHISEQDIDNIKRIFRDYKINDYIYVGVFKQAISVDIKTALSILNILKKHGFLEMNYGYYCFDCERPCSPIYETYGKLPLNVYCEYCERELTFTNNSILLYKVIKTNE